MSDYVTVGVSISDLDRYLFKKYCIDLGNWTDVLDMNEVKRTTELNVAGFKIGDISNLIRRMPKLEKLDCSGNELWDIDLSNNRRLKELICRDNYLNELDLSFNEKIAYVDYRGNAIYDDRNFIQPGFMIYGTRWSLVNLGSQSSGDCGTFFPKGKDDLYLSCPTGWRLPTAYELNALYIYGMSLGVVDGHSGWWMGGQSEEDSIFLPETTDMGYGGKITYLSDSNSELELWKKESGAEGGMITPSETSGYVRCVKEWN